MAEITIKIGGKVQMNDAKYEDTREALAEIAKTSNVASKTVASGLTTLDKLGGAKLFADMLASGKQDAKIEVLADEKPVAEYTVGNFARRILVALDAANWTGTIYTEKSEKKSADSVPQELPKLTW